MSLSTIVANARPASSGSCPGLDARARKGRRPGRRAARRRRHRGGSAREAVRRSVRQDWRARGACRRSRWPRPRRDSACTRRRRLVGLARRRPIRSLPCRACTAQEPSPLQSAPCHPTNRCPGAADAASVTGVPLRQRHRARGAAVDAGRCAGHGTAAVADALHREHDVRPRGGDALSDLGSGGARSPRGSHHGHLIGRTASPALRIDGTDREVVAEPWPQPRALRTTSCPSAPAPRRRRRPAQAPTRRRTRRRRPDRAGPRQRNALAWARAGNGATTRTRGKHGKDRGASHTRAHQAGEPGLANRSRFVHEAGGGGRPAWAPSTLQQMLRLNFASGRASGFGKNCEEIGRSLARVFPFGSWSDANRVRRHRPDLHGSGRMRSSDVRAALRRRRCPGRHQPGGAALRRRSAYVVNTP